MEGDKEKDTKRPYLFRVLVNKLLCAMGLKAEVEEENIADLFLF